MRKPSCRKHEHTHTKSSPSGSVPNTSKDICVKTFHYHWLENHIQRNTFASQLWDFRIATQGVKVLVLSACCVSDNASHSCSFGCFQAHDTIFNDNTPSGVNI
mmetsp:Transcript_50494/g.107556  ORF Transcript_50494/g.107556 Transcript_50494/m.107556 type:complete len:103 (+) Transcript_50494:904-1212(+)